MTYTLTSRLTPHVAPADGWMPLLAAHGAYGGAEAIVGAYDRWCGMYGVDANLALAQACHEATYFTSARWRQEWNPAGLGITANNTPANPFRSLDEGIRAHIEHLCCHAYTASTCPVSHQALADRRHFFHLGDVTLEGIQTDGFRWAAGQPGQDPLDYVRSICAIANGVVGQGGEMSDYPTEGDIGGPIRVEPTDFDNGPRPLAEIDWYVVHDTEGHYEGDIAVLTHGSRNGSVHAIIGREDGQFCASVPISRSAFTAGNDQLGDRAVQVELSKATNETGYTDWQYTTLARFFQWCARQGVTVPFVYLGLHPADADKGPLPDERGIIGHAGVPNPNVPGAWGGVSGHTDPGPDFDWPRFIALLGASPAPSGWITVDGKLLGPGFAQMYLAVPELFDTRKRTYGVLLKGDHDATLTTAEGAKVPVVAAIFERNTLIWDKGATPDEWSVRVPLATEQVS